MKDTAATPVAFFVYNRPDHTRRAIEALLANDLAPETDLHVFSDGARSAEDAEAVGAVRAYVRGLTGFRSVRLVERPENWGGPRSIPAGISEVCLATGRVVVLEDDIVSSPFFLEYMNTALRLYADDPEVLCVSGSQQICAAPSIALRYEGLPDTFFLRSRTSNQAWGTWDRAWNLMPSDVGEHARRLRQDTKLARSFDLGGYQFTSALERSPAPWDARWAATAFLEGKLTLFPLHPLVRNIGFDGSGAHVDPVHEPQGPPIALSPIEVRRLVLAENEAARRRMVRGFKTIDCGGLRGIYRRGKRRLRVVTHDPVRVARAVGRRARRT